MSSSGKPLQIREAGVRPVGEWWRSATGAHSGLRLRRGFVRVHPGPPWLKGAEAYAPMKDLIRRRGIAARLYLVLLYEQQLLHRNRGRWSAPQVPDRQDWKDRQKDGELVEPGWATLVLGYEDRPVNPTRRSRWQRTRYEAVRNGFARLEQLGFVDPSDQVLNREDRHWRWNPKAASHRYEFPTARRDAVFEVPSWVFTSGTYLRLSGAGLYTLLLACEYEQSPGHYWPFDKAGLRWTTAKPGFDELKKVYLNPYLTDAVKLLSAVQQLDEIRYQPPAELAEMPREVLQEALDSYATSLKGSVRRR